VIPALHRTWQVSSSSTPEFYPFVRRTRTSGCARAWYVLPHRPPPLFFSNSFSVIPEIGHVGQPLYAHISFMSDAYRVQLHATLPNAYPHKRYSLLSWFFSSHLGIDFGISSLVQKFSSNSQIRGRKSWKVRLSFFFLVLPNMYIQLLATADKIGLTLMRVHASIHVPHQMIPSKVLFRSYNANSLFYSMLFG